MHIAILGRQPAIGIAELERVFGRADWFSDATALVDSDRFDIEALGGTQKAGRVVLELPARDWPSVSTKIIQHYSRQFVKAGGKLTFGLSAYGFTVGPRDVQKTGLALKTKLKSAGVSVRLVPNQTAALNTAASHHNKLGLSANKIELLVVKGRDKTIVAESVGAQNITAIAARDQARPKRDAFVGMLPPKLAQIMINLAGAKQGMILDPFCGTGVILQEALLMGYDVYGSDLSDKMIAYTEENLKWLASRHTFHDRLAAWQVGDATSLQWFNSENPDGPVPLHIDAVVSETYLGQPFSAPPSPAKLTEVRGNCDHIISGFLKNLASQIAPGTPLCLAVPAWRDAQGNVTRLPLVGRLDKLGYQRVALKAVTNDQLLYYRPDQVVARELLILTRMAT